MRFSVAIPTSVDATLQQHLLRPDRQEDLCFALWHPSQGATRTTALIGEALLPLSAERRVHGNTSFLPEYVERVIKVAVSNGAGVAFLHSHLGPGWQGMSPDDVAAETGLAPAVKGATGLPLVGLTLGTDGAWSARFWEKQAARRYERKWCESVRVVGDCLRVTYYDSLLPPPRIGPKLTRTVSAWGERKQSELARLRIGIAGAGSVGCIVAEALARMGIGRITLIDFDGIEEINLDRLLHASESDIGKAKVAMLAAALKRSATAEPFSVLPLENSIVEEDGFRAALDCDVLFSCVDRPWARYALNLIAYAHLIPVIDGGIAITTRPEKGLRHCTIRAHVAAPGRRCLECLGQYQSELVSLERDGWLDDPSYIKGLAADHPLKRRENVFGFSNMAASLEIMQMLSMVIAPSRIGNVGAQVYHFVDGSLDKENDPTCNQACFFSTVIARGDRAGVSCTERHRVAEDGRSARATPPQQLPRRGWGSWFRSLWPKAGFCRS
jgi:hypothetical protein